jgi:hypothetical protein
LVSNITFAQSQTRANDAIVPPRDSREIKVFCGGQTTHFIAALNGFFARKGPRDRAAGAPG